MVADRSVLVRLRADISDFQRKFATAGATTSVFVKNLESADSRMGNLVQTALALAPALVPISATAVPALVGLTSQVGAAAAGVGVLVAAFHGVGGALDALNKYQLDPTDANLKKMREEMHKLPAEGRHFVRFLDQEVMPALDWLQDSAAEGVLPGFEDSISSLMRRLPEVSVLVEDLATRSGDLAAQAGEAIASDELDDFFDFLRTEAGPTLTTLSQTVGNILDGLASSLIGLNPLANDFEDALLDWARGFSEIEPEDFTEFVAYVRDVGPDALDALSAIGGGLVAIVKAAAPVGAVTLPVIEALANVIEVIAESPAGPALIGTAAGLSAVSRSIALFKAANGSALVNTIQGVGKAAPTATAGLGKMNQTISAMKTGAPILAGLALAYSDVDDKAGLSNTTMLATAGLIAGGWGAAVGGAIGLFLDWKAAGAQAEAQNRAFEASIAGMSLEELNAGLAETQGLLAALGGGDGLANDMASDLLRTRIGLIEHQIDVTKELEAQREAERREAAMAYAEQAGLNLSAAKSTRMTTEQIKAQADAVREVRDAGRSAAESFLAYSDSIDDSKVSLSEWLREQEESAEALRNFNTNALRAAKNGLDDGLILSLQNTGKEGALRMKQLANATEDEIGRANKAWRRGQAEMERTEDIAQRLADLSPVKVDINAETGRAMTNLRSLETYLKSLPTNKDIFINVRHRQYGQSGGFGPVDAGADGLTIPGPRHPYGDKVLILAAPSEELISNRHGEADAFRADRAAGRIPRYAGGGTVGRPTASSLNAPRSGDLHSLSPLMQALLQFGSLERALKASEKALDRETTEREAATSAVEATRSAMADLASATTAGFTGDPFAERAGDTDIWRAGARGASSDPISALMGDIAYGQQRQALQQQVQAAGLGGSTPGEQAALAEALKSANNDALASMLANGTVQQFEDLFIQRQGVVDTVGGEAARAVYGDTLQGQLDEQKQATEELRGARQELRHIQRLIERQTEREEQNAERTGEAVGHVINGPATRAAMKNRDRKPRKPQ